jgi:hypothetical protein
MMVEKTLTKKERSLVTRLVISGCVHPNYYNGSGRWTRKGPDYAARLVSILGAGGMVAGKHFEAGNDAPRSGHEGAYVRLLPLGHRRKLCRDIREEFYRLVVFESSATLSAALRAGLL